MYYACLVLLGRFVVNTTRSSMSSIGSGGRDRQAVTAVDSSQQVRDDLAEKRSRSLSRSSQHSRSCSDDADERSRTSYGVRFAAVSFH